MKPGHFTVLLILICLNSGIVNSQFLRTISYQESNGLPSNVVMDMTQDDDGAIWFITQRGIAVYNGVKWRIFPDSVQLPSGFGSKIYYDEEYGIITSGIGKSGLLLKIYKGEVWSDIPIPVQPRAQGKTRFHFDQSSKAFYTLIDNQLFRYDFQMSEWENPLEISHENEFIKILTINGNTYLLGEKGLYDVTKGVFLMVPEKFHPLQDLFWDEEVGNVYVVGNHKVAYSTGNDITDLQEIVDESPNPGASDFASIVKYDNQRILIYNGGKLSIFNTVNGDIEVFQINALDVNEWISSVFIDKERNIWIGSFRGVRKINNMGFKNYSKESGLFDGEGTVIGQFDNGTLFLGGVRSYAYLADNQILSYPLGTTAKEGASQRMIGIVKDRQNTMWVASSNKGLGQFKEDGSVTWNVKKGFEYISCVEIIDGTIYVGSIGGKVFTFKDGQFEEFFSNNRYIRRISQVKDGRMVIITNAGTVIINDGVTKELQPEGTADQSAIYSILEIDNHILLGSFEGLFELAGDRILPLQLKGHKITRPIYEMMQRRNGDVWFGTDNGVYVVTSDGRLVNYNQKSGIEGYEVNRGGLFETEDETVWIGTNAGFSSFHEEFHRKDLPGSEVEIISVKVNGKETNLISSLSSEQNDISFEFISTSLIDESNIQYRFRLDGLEEHWNYHDYKQNIARYSGLQANVYQFVVQSRFGEGQWSDQVQSQVFRIRKPFYSQIWFIVLLTVVVGYIGYVTNTYVNQRKHNRLLKDAIEIKVLEVQDSKEKLESRNIELESEINQRKRIQAELKTSKNELEIYSRQLEDMVKERTADYEKANKELTVTNAELLTQKEQLKEALNELRSAQKQLVQSEKMASLGVLTAGVAHEINNPLNFIQSGIYGLENIMASKDVSQSDLNLVKEIVDRMRIGIKRASDIVVSLKTFSRSEDDQISKNPVKLHDVINSCLVILTHEIKGRIEIERVFGKKEITIEANESGLHQVILNLITNAIQSISEKGKIIIGTELIESDKKIRITVADNGAGIPKKYQKRIFDPFFTTKEPGIGTGLGLSIVFNILKEHNGSITFDSDGKNGTLATVILPMKVENLA